MVGLFHKITVLSCKVQCRGDTVSTSAHLWMEPLNLTTRPFLRGLAPPRRLLLYFLSLHSPPLAVAVISAAIICRRKSAAHALSLVLRLYITTSCSLPRSLAPLLFVSKQRKKRGRRRLRFSKWIMEIADADGRTTVVEYAYMACRWFGRGSTSTLEEQADLELEAMVRLLGSLVSCQGCCATAKHCALQCLHPTHIS